MELAPDRFFNWIWHLLVHEADEKQRQRIEMDVNRPLPGQHVASGPWSDEEMAASFMTAAASFTKPKT